jgi:hypothetical protein
LGSFIANNIVTHSIALVYYCTLASYLVGFSMSDALFVTMLYDLSVAFNCVNRRLGALKADESLQAKDDKLKDIIKDHIACIRLGKVL